ncbi:MAG: phosphatase PAP2 family protein [Brumimicrobium sp.]
MKKNKTISSLEMENRNERSAPIALMTVYCLILFLFLSVQKDEVFIPQILKAMVLGGVLSCALAYFITKKIKISFHSIGMGSLFGFLYMYSKPLIQTPVVLLVLVLLLGGIVMSSRMILNAHKLKEVNLGYIIGAFSQIVSIFLYLKL